MTLDLPFAASSVAVVRRELRAWLLDQDVSHEEIENARVVLSELVANSIRHARPLADGTLRVAWRYEGDGLRLSVTDGGGVTRPRAVDAPSSALAGRGITIVESLSSQWWAERTRTRSTVHAVLSMG